MPYEWPARLLQGIEYERERRCIFTTAEQLLNKQEVVRAAVLQFSCCWHNVYCLKVSVC